MAQTPLYDTIIIGAGIAGASTAYFLTQKGQKVLVLDRGGIAPGGSGAAGAFVSPKIGKGSPLQQLTNEAFAFAYEFYQSFCPVLYHATGVIRIPKDENDAERFHLYEPFNTNTYERYSVDKLSQLGVKADFDSFFFPQAGAVEARETCEKLLEGIECIAHEVQHIELRDGVWHADDYRAANLVLATGYEEGLIDLRYMGLRRTWGTRGDFISALPLEVSMHQSMSVSANLDGVIRLGATHEKSVQEPIPCDDAQALSLKERAAALIDTSDLQLVTSYCGMRSGSHDYFPLVGQMVDAACMLENFPAVTRGAKPPLKHIDNLYFCGGLGGRGFVFGPLMGKMLADRIVDNIAVDDRVNPDRLFLKWARKSKASHSG